MPPHFAEGSSRASKRETVLFRTMTRGQRCAKHSGVVFPLVFFFLAAGLSGVGVWSFLERRKLVRGEEMEHDLDRYLKKEARKDLMYSEDPTFLAMAAGGFGMLMAVIGFLGFLRKRSCLLALFIAGVVVFFVVTLATGFMALVYRETLEMDAADLVKQEVKSQMNEVILNTQPEFNAGPVTYTQTRFRCCGIETFEDWDRSIHFNCTSRRCVVPISCCLDKTCDGRVGGSGDVKNIFTQGCVESTDLALMVEEAVDTDDLMYLSICGFVLVPLSMVVLFMAALHLHYLETR